MPLKVDIGSGPNWASAKQRQVEQEGPASRDWFHPIARHRGPAYLRQAFTRGTDQEVGFLVDALELEPGA